MSVTKQKNGKWLCLVNRKGLKRVRKQFNTESEALQFEREYIVGLQFNPIKISDPRTLLELINIWYKYHGINLAQKEKLLNQLKTAAVEMGNPVGHMLTPEMIVKYRYKRLYEDNPPISAKTFNNIHSAISAVYNTLRKLRVINYENPINELDKLRLQERQLTYLSEKQIKDLLESIKTGCQNPSTWYVANICLRTGARWGEAMFLTRKQLHGKNLITFEKTKGKKTRSLPLDETFYNDLLDFCRLSEPSERIFTNCYSSFRKAVKRADITLPKGQLSHVLRHSFASHFMINKGNIITLQNILGHTDIKMTMRYAHLSPSHFRDVIELNPLANL